MGMDISGLTGGGSASLNDDMISKLRAEDEKVTVKPLEKRLEDWDKGSESYDLVKIQVDELKDVLSLFSQTNTTTNVFDAVSPSTSGDSVLYDANGTLQDGTTNVKVTQLATRDVYQSDKITNSKSDINGGDFVFKIGEDDSITIDTTNLNYEELSTEINKQSKGKIEASLTQIDDQGTYRMVLKSHDTGQQNIINIESDIDKLDFNGTNDDGITNHIQTAQNLNATIDGIEYDVSSNTLDINESLSMTAVKLGDSSINIQKDPTYVIDAIDKFVEVFNSLVETIDNESKYNEETKEPGALQNSNQIKDMLDGIKDKFFGSYGDDVGNKENIFGHGFELDRYGKLSVDHDAFSKEMSTSPDQLKELLVGTPENKGIMEELNEYVDRLDSLNGILTVYEKNMEKDHESLNEAKDKAIKDLDNKYSNMKQQFSRYSVLISQMESSFSSLDFQIKEATASK